MNNAINNVRKGLLGKSEAIAKHKARKQEFIKTRERIIQDFEEARKIWGSTLEQLSKTTIQGFYLNNTEANNNGDNY